MKNNLIKQWTTDISNEVIAQQSDQLHKDLTEAFRRVHKQSRRIIHRSSFKEDVRSIIKKHLGLHADVNIGNSSDMMDDYPFCCGVVNPVLQNEAAKYERMFKRIAEDSVKLEFDTKNLLIKGDTSKITAFLGITTQEIIDGRLTPEELSAIIIHELGHFWTILYFSSRLTRINIALESLAKGLKEEKDPTKRKMVAKIASSSDIDVADRWLNMDCDYSAKDEVIISLAMKTSLDAIAADLGNPEYGYNMFEHVADLFATRHGAGLDLVTGLAKLVNDSGASFAFFAFSQTFLAVISISAMLINPVGMFFTGLLLLALVHLNTTPGESEMRYDKLSDRYKRVRNQIQLRMRIKSKNKAEFEFYKNQLAELDKIISMTKDWSSSFNNWYAILFSSKTRARNRQAELELFFEDLAYNRLYEKSLDFKYM